MNATESMIAEFNKLAAENASITKAGGFFTAKQIENADKAWKIKMDLRFNHNINVEVR